MCSSRRSCQTAAARACGYCSARRYSCSGDSFNRILEKYFAETDGLFSEVKFLNDGYLELLVKILWIAAVTKIGSDICKDSANSALATIVELVGKTVILAMCLSLIKTLAEISKGLLK